MALTCDVITINFKFFAHNLEEDAPKEPEEEVLDVAQLEAIRQEQLKKYILPLKMAVEKQFFTDLFKKAAEQDAANKKSGKQKK